MHRTDAISLVGMTGVGKTTVGRALARRLGRDFIDLDIAIAEKCGKTPSEIFALFGEAAFRRIETEQLEAIFEARPENLVLSCGGGIVIGEKNREILKAGSYVAWLWRPIGEIAKNKDILLRPPIYGDIHNYERIFSEREKLYAAVCDLKIDCTDASAAVEAIAKNIERIEAEEGRAPSRQ